MAWRMRLRSPPAAGDSGQAKTRFILTLAAVGLTLGLFLTAVTVYAIWTNTTSVTPSFDSDTLDPGTVLTAPVSGSNVNLSWVITPDSYAAGYRVLRSTTSGSDYVEIATVTPRANTSYTDSPAADDTYYYVVRAYYQNWESVNSNQASAIVGSGPQTFVSEIDSYVQEDLPTTNFGTATLMDVQSFETIQTSPLRRWPTPTSRRTWPAPTSAPRH